MARKARGSVEASPPEAAAPGGKLRLLTFLLAGYAAVASSILLFKKAPGASGTPGSAPGNLQALLDAEAAKTRGEVKDDLTKAVKDFKEALERAVKQVDGERSRLQAVADQASRRANEAIVKSTSHSDVLDAKLDEVSQSAKTLKETVDGLSLQLKEIASRPVVAAPAARATPEAPTPAKPADVPEAPAGPTAEEIAANKVKVRAAIADIASGDVGKIFAACTILGKLGDLEAVEPVVKVLKEHKDPYVRMAALNAIGALHACDGVPALLASLVDKDDGVCLTAARSFSKITNQDTGLSGSPSKREKTDAMEKWGRWWKDHETEVRARWNQTVAAPAVPAAPEAPGEEKK